MLVAVMLQLTVYEGKDKPRSFKLKYLLIPTFLAKVVACLQLHKLAKKLVLVKLGDIVFSRI